MSAETVEQSEAAFPDAEVERQLEAGEPLEARLDKAQLYLRAWWARYLSLESFRHQAEAEIQRIKALVEAKEAQVEPQLERIEHSLTAIYLAEKEKAPKRPGHLDLLSGRVSFRQRPAKLSVTDPAAALVALRESEQGRRAIEDVPATVRVSVDALKRILKPGKTTLPDTGEVVDGIEWEIPTDLSVSITPPAQRRKAEPEAESAAEAEVTEDADAS